MNESLARKKQEKKTGAPTARRRESTLMEEETRVSICRGAGSVEENDAVDAWEVKARRLR